MAKNNNENDVASFLTELKDMTPERPARQHGSAHAASHSLFLQLPLLHRHRRYRRRPPAPRPP